MENFIKLFFAHFAWTKHHIDSYYISLLDGRLASPHPV
jgi:hypothetical protein